MLFISLWTLSGIKGIISWDGYSPWSSVKYDLYFCICSDDLQNFREQAGTQIIVKIAFTLSDDKKDVKFPANLYTQKEKFHRF